MNGEDKLDWTHNEQEVLQSVSENENENSW